MPASTTTGTLLCSMMISSIALVCSPWLVPMGAPKRHHRRCAGLFQPLAQHRVGVDISHHEKPSFASCSVANMVSIGSGSR